MSKCVKVKIAVVINEEGEWSAAGWNCSETGKSVIADIIYDSDAMDTASEMFNDEDDTLKRYWITAELETPEKVKIEEIDGEVKNVKDG